jgi:transcriptional regulator with XRE-family HTH domain
MTKTIGQVIQEYRKKRKLSLRGLGTELKISHSQIDSIEKGESDPSYKTLIKIVKGLDIPKTVIKLPELGK